MASHMRIQQRHLILTAATLAAAGLASAAKASSIGVQFYGGATSNGTSLPSGTSAGVVPLSGWIPTNETSPGNAEQTWTTTPSDSSGNQFAFTISAANGANSGTFDSGYTDTGAKDLFSGFITSATNNTTNSVANYTEVQITLPAAYVASGYSVYAYANRSSAVSEYIGVNTSGINPLVGTSTFTPSNFDQYVYLTSASLTTYTQVTATTGTNNGNYAQFSGLNASTLYVFVDNTAQGAQFLSGLEVVQAPEPTTLSLIALSAAAMLPRRRRNAPKHQPYQPAES